MASARNYMEPSRIDYYKLADGLGFYETRGYRYIETPWVVSHDAMEVTLPPGLPATTVQYGDLVGSGEQSFIELLRRGETITKACCITPCFRIEHEYDELHHAYFMKLELINTEVSPGDLQQTITDAKEFHEQYISVDIEKTGPDTYDIVDTKHRIELGSYGIRAFNNTKFIYGTGIALPRVDNVLAKK